MSESAKDLALKRLQERVAAFRDNEKEYLSSSYNETQARTDFISPLLEIFGWDVSNSKNMRLAFREVIEEATVDVEEEKHSKRPDYELRLARQRKMFVEAKKPTVRIAHDKPAAFQARRYGYSAGLPISVLTNFHQLAIYDCRPIPDKDDNAHVARLLLVGYEDFVARFDELWPLLSRESIYSGDFDLRFPKNALHEGTEPFDAFFLNQVRNWRERLATSIFKNTPSLSAEELNFSVQRFLLRIVFLRICEDRELEKYESLKDLATGNTFEALMQTLRRADEFYDSGLFRLIDDESLGIKIGNEDLQAIISELYYPQSPYTFSVIETEVLGEIYEQFLGDVVVITKGIVTIINKPEIREGGGVFPTPAYITDRIVERTISSAIRGKSPGDLLDFTAADICCGSGIFLLSIFELLMDYYLSWYLTNDRDEYRGNEIYEDSGGEWRLTFEEKRRILLAHIRGVDIDSSAIEVAQFSLLLKLLEGECALALKEYVERKKSPALPSLDGIVRWGNSLVSPTEWAIVNGVMDSQTHSKISPFCWKEEFPVEMRRGGFDVIVGNPPYIRLQKMVAFFPEEVDYYQNEKSPFQTSQQLNFDKYELFIERSLSLTCPSGRVGMIVPHKFMITKAGAALRKLFSASKCVEEIIHFGTQPVFGANVSNYTCILILSVAGVAELSLERTGPLPAWRYGKKGQITTIPSSELSANKWGFANRETKELFDRIKKENPHTLAELAEIMVGAQTSANDIYIVSPISETADLVTFVWNKQEWEIERNILRPSLHKTEISAYSQPRANAFMIFPYEEVPNKRGVVRARLMQPDAMRANFPKCWKYLSARRKELEKRSITGGPKNERQWYQFGRSQSLTRFSQPKIILPVLSREARYSFDGSGIVIEGGGSGPYYMLSAKVGAKVTNLYLLGVLNHPICEAMVRTITSSFKGGFYSHGKQFIQNLPIPIPDKETLEAVECRVTTLLDIKMKIVGVRIPRKRIALERQAGIAKQAIEDSVSKIFSLSEEELEICMAVPIPE